MSKSSQEGRVVDDFEALTAIAFDLTTALSAGDRYRRLLDALGRVIPYDAAALMRFEDGELVPVAAKGLSAVAMGRRFHVVSEPRLEAICQARGPVRFASDDPTPDPFDGMLEGVPSGAHRIHSCLGSPLRVKGRLIGTLTADALDPMAFGHLDLNFLGAVAALASAQLQLAEVMDELESTAERQELIARDLAREARMRQGRDLLGHGRAMTRLRQEIDQVARSDFTVLVQGETGVGKELVVRKIHAASQRKDAPLLYLDCAALPETLAESELFGHTRGAYTGATQGRPGKFEMADGGTLFLDEVGELSLSIQPKLLRAIQEGEVQRIGSNKIVPVNVRLLAATNRNLGEEVKAGRFRADLYHRLSVYPLTVPPLRERREDIPVLAEHFCEEIRKRLGLGPVRLAPDLLDALLGYDWPGNVRELENMLSRAILKASFASRRSEPVNVEPHHLHDLIVSSGPSPSLDSGAPGPTKIGLKPLRGMIDDFKRRVILEAVSNHGGNLSAAARDLGIARSNLHKMVSRLGLRGKT